MNTPTATGDCLADLLRLARRIRRNELERHRRWQQRHLGCDDIDQVSRAHRRLDRALHDLEDELCELAVDQRSIHRLRCVTSTVHARSQP